MSLIYLGSQKRDYITASSAITSDTPAKIDLNYSSGLELCSKFAYSKAGARRSKEETLCQAGGDSLFHAILMCYNNDYKNTFNPKMKYTDEEINELIGNTRYGSKEVKFPFKLFRKLGNICYLSSECLMSSLENYFEYWRRVYAKKFRNELADLLEIDEEIKQQFCSLSGIPDDKVVDHVRNSNRPSVYCAVLLHLFDSVDRPLYMLDSGKISLDAIKLCSSVKTDTIECCIINKCCDLQYSVIIPSKENVTTLFDSLKEFRKGIRV